MVRNVHERVVKAPAETVGRLLDTLGSAADRVWPQPPLTPMVLRHPAGAGLALGATGGHGGVRYSVQEYIPGKQVSFVFGREFPFVGSHAFTATASGSDTVVRHELVGTPRGAMRVLWPLVVRPMHDCYAEDALDRIERELGVGPVAEHRHSLLIRLFESRLRRRVTACEPLLDGLGRDAVSRVDAADAFRTDLLPGDGIDPVAWTTAIFAAVPWWVNALLRVRHAIVRPFGLRTGDIGSAAIFPLHARTTSEALFGIDDKHLDFRVVTTVDEFSRFVTMTTVVRVHSGLGRAYWSIVRHFHPIVVRSLMRRAAHPAGAQPIDA